ncbi:hypothetical protein V494_00616 [Pseudogymnoascus sp. VKM F-4513 (FW-928)]|nr:hypothetical protein V494_00616 [Pseudogymnoascus sp. VKM F-4513 (FW-928)]
MLFGAAPPPSVITTSNDPLLLGVPAPPSLPLELAGRLAFFAAAAFCINAAPFENERSGARNAWFSAADGGGAELRLLPAGTASDSVAKVLALNVALAKTPRRDRAVPVELSIDSGMEVTVLLLLLLCLPAPLGVREKERGRSALDEEVDDDGGVANFVDDVGVQQSPYANDGHHPCLSATHTAETSMRRRCSAYTVRILRSTLALFESLSPPCSAPSRDVLDDTGGCSSSELTTGLYVSETFSVPCVNVASIGCRRVLGSIKLN